MNGASSNPLRVTSGVPQGSILGPLLFLIYIDDIAHISLSEGSKLVLYADDVLLYHPISSPRDYELLQCDVDAVQAYASTQHMTLNTTKCIFMLVSQKNRPSIPSVTISLDGVPLENITTLGVLLSSDLSWSSHIQNLVQRQGSYWDSFIGDFTDIQVNKLYINSTFH